MMDVSYCSCLSSPLNPEMGEKGAAEGGTLTGKAIMTTIPFVSMMKRKTV